MKSINLYLLIGLIMFPQIAETMYSPILPSLAHAFGVSAAQVSLTISLYFFAFALGVVVWGISCDRLGRRTSMLLGLALYASAALYAAYTDNFYYLLAARLVSAFAAAVASIATQTIFRDVYQGVALGKVFSLVGMALGVSPALGLALGGLLLFAAGYQAVLLGLASLAVVLWLCTSLLLAETKPAVTSEATISFYSLCKKMLVDRHILQSVALISLFNIALFSYYQLAPFIFEALGAKQQFSYSGVLLSIGIVLGAWLNKVCLAKQYTSQRIITLASVCLLLGGIGSWLLQSNITFVLPITLVFIAYGLGIATILAGALRDYQAVLGSAGAILGLLYYVLISLGLLLVGYLQHLPIALVVAGGLSLYLTRKQP